MKWKVREITTLKVEWLTWRRLRIQSRLQMEPMLTAILSMALRPPRWIHIHRQFRRRLRGRRPWGRHHPGVGRPTVNRPLVNLILTIIQLLKSRLISMHTHPRPTIMGRKGHRDPRIPDQVFLHLVHLLWILFCKVDIQDLSTLGHRIRGMGMDRQVIRVDIMGLHRVKPPEVIHLLQDGIQIITDM